MTQQPALRLGALDGGALAAGYADGSLSPVDVVRSALDDIAEREPGINAFSDVTADEALAAAEASARRWADGAPLGDLDGVPVTVKENMHRAGVRARAGTAAITGAVPAADSPIVARLKEAGAPILGSTTMPDWGMLSSGVSSLHGITRSPVDPSLTVGGSSAGAGAAAAAGFGAVHLGTDIGGSVRLPAAWLGLAALKPSDGRIPIDNPYLGRAAGPIARTVADLARAMTAVSQPDVRDYTSLPPQRLDWSDLDIDLRGRRIAVHTDAGAGMPVDPEVAAAVRAAADRFAAAGAEVTEIAPFVSERMLDDIDLFWRVRFWRTYRALPVERQRAALPFIATWVHGGADVPGWRALECYETIGELRSATVLATARHDFVLSPVAPVAAFPAEWPMPWGHEDAGMPHIAFTLPYNMSGQPASSINAGFSADGRALALQIAGRRYADLDVLRATAWYERHRPPSAVPEFV